MTAATVSLALILTILALLPCVFLAAGKDTDNPRALQEEIRQEVLLDWTDKTILAAESSAARTPAGSRPQAPACPVTVIHRDNLSALTV